MGHVSALTGRLAGPVSALLADEVLASQFRHDVAHLLPWYVRIEKVLLLEYRRMALVPADAAEEIAAALDAADSASLTPDRTANFVDVTFALERFVESRLTHPAPAWHADRSRNDLQATAQLLFARQQVRETAGELLTCAQAAHRLAAGNTDTPMPGFTHGQAAQVITPGFFFSAVVELMLGTLDRLLTCYDSHRAPLGAGAMAGQELPWDRDRMARLLGFRAAERHALVSVASRAWALELAAECSTFGVGLSRFVTDLMAWTSSAYRFADLPDELSAISSAMPQKKNFPILERVRGRLAHLTTGYLDLALTQRNAPFSNTVEVSKEGQLLPLLATLRSALRLLTAALDGMTFDAEHLRNSCGQEFLGGFSLANALTTRAGVPWRTAQVVAGRYILAAMTQDGTPESLAEAAGISVDTAKALLREAFDPVLDLRRKNSPGGTAPAAVRELLATQAADLAELSDAWTSRTERSHADGAHLDTLLATAEEAHTR